MKKPRDKYKKEIKTHQIISIKKQKRFIFINLLSRLYYRQAHTGNLAIQIECIDIRHARNVIDHRLNFAVQTGGIGFILLGDSVE